MLPTGTCGADPGLVLFSNVEDDTSVAVAEDVVVVEVVEELLPLNNDFNNTFCCCCSALLLTMVPGGPDAPGVEVITPGPDPAAVMVTPNEGTTAAIGPPCSTVVGITDCPIVVEDRAFCPWLGFEPVIPVVLIKRGPVVIGVFNELDMDFISLMAVDEAVEAATDWKGCVETTGGIGGTEPPGS